jgi:hypothetical protein
VCHYIVLYTHYKQILNAALRNILKRKNVIYAMYNVLSNWSRGTNSARHPFRKTPTNSRLLGSANPKNDHAVRPLTEEPEPLARCGRGVRADAPVGLQPTSAGGVARRGRARAIDKIRIDKIQSASELALRQFSAQRRQKHFSLNSRMISRLFENRNEIEVAIGEQIICT